VKVLPVNWDSCQYWKYPVYPSWSATSECIIPRNQHPRCFDNLHASKYRLYQSMMTAIDIIRLRPLQNLLPAGNTSPERLISQQLTLTGHGERRRRRKNSSASLFYFHRSNPFSTKSFSWPYSNLVSPDIIILPLLAHSIGVMYQRVRWSPHCNPSASLQ